jgi:hypothetical protein
MSKKRIHWLRLLAALTPVVIIAAFYPLGYLASLLFTVIVPAAPMPDGVWETMATGALAFIVLCVIALVLYVISHFVARLFVALSLIAELLIEWIYNDK